jgi:glycine hydroxymethyltransferase
MERVVELIDEVLSDWENDEVINSVAERVNDMMEERPLFVW